MTMNMSVLVSSSDSMENCSNTTCAGPNSNIPSIIQLVSMWAVCFLTVTFNITVFIVVPRCDFLKNSTGWAMLSLALTDLLLGCSHIIRLSYMAATGKYILQDGFLLCRIDNFLVATFASVSIMTLTFLSMDRFLILCLPLRYNIYMTCHKTFCILLSIWISMMVCMAPILWISGRGPSSKFYLHAYMCLTDWTSNLTYTLIIAFFVEIVPTVVILLSFIGIYRIAKVQSKRLTDQEQQTTLSGSFRKEMRIVRTLLLMTVGFYIAWTPYFITVTFWELFTNETVGSTSDFVSSWLGASNSFWNPILYIPTMKPFRMTLIKMLGIRRNKTGVEHTQISSPP